VVLIPVATHSKIWFCGCSSAGIAGSNPAGAFMSVPCQCCVLSSRGICGGPITRPENSNRVCDLETSTMRMSRTARAIKPWKKLYTLSSFVLSLYPIRKHLEYYRFNYKNSCHIHTFWPHHNPSISTGFYTGLLSLFFQRRLGRIRNNYNYRTWNI